MIVIGATHAIFDGCVLEVCATAVSIRRFPLPTQLKAVGKECPGEIDR